MPRFQRRWQFGLLLLLIGCSSATDKQASRETSGIGPVVAEDRSDDETFAQSPASSTNQAGRKRRFLFDYRFTLTKMEPGNQIRLWLPAPVSNTHQQIEILPHELPAEVSSHTEPKYENRILYLEPTIPANGELAVHLPYRVERREVLSQRLGVAEVKSRLTHSQRNLFLQANAKVPIEGKPLALLRGIDLSDHTSLLARQIYDVVDRHVTYKKTGTGWGEGNVLWVCDSGYGNCTDFHSLFISLARSQGLPARFEIGFPIPNTAREGAVGGYHCWAWFHTEQNGWTPVDISEADKHPEQKEYFFGNLGPDRVTFSTGRDIDLVPKQRGDALNYFIYPYAEVDGKPVSPKQISLEFRYRDIE